MNSLISGMTVDEKAREVQHYDIKSYFIFAVQKGA